MRRIFPPERPPHLIVKTRLPSYLVVLAAAVYVPACAISDSSSPSHSLTEPYALTDASPSGYVVVTPATSSIAVGATVQLTAKYYSGSGGLMRGVFLWNSEVGAGAFKVQTFLL